MTVNQDQTTREIAIQYPGAVPIFESLGIDYCCGGSRPLREACERAHADWEHVARLLQAVDTAHDPSASDWTAQPLDALTHHIVGQHHAYVRRTTPQIGQWLDKVVAKHGPAHPEVDKIRALFTTLSEELSTHMLKEERILFPHLECLVAAERGESAGVRALRGSVEAPIRRMLAEHDDAGEALAKIRVLSSGYQPPEDACPTYRALYHGLAEFERDLHQHVHLENNILFPRALDLEHRLLAGQEREHVRG
jgi:regulator of cell morphogenesis and NO signaling